MYLVPLTSLPSIQEQGQPVAGQGASGGEGQSFASIMREAIETLQETQAAGAQDSYDLATGDIGSLHNMMINSVMEATAVETAVQLTSRAVSAYKEIMQMQI